MKWIVFMQLRKSAFENLVKLIIAIIILHFKSLYIIRIEIFIMQTIVDNGKEFFRICNRIPTLNKVFVLKFTVIYPWNGTTMVYHIVNCAWSWYSQEVSWQVQVFFTGIRVFVHFLEQSFTPKPVGNEIIRFTCTHMKLNFQCFCDMKKSAIV